MKKGVQIWTGIFASIGMLFLIIDTKTALEGAKEGISLCTLTVIPALFPFIILSSIICGSYLGRTSKLLKPLSRLCGIPYGSESILILGFLSGYPIGAQSIYQAYSAKQLSKTDAQRMLGFCSNAGPAFIFGMLGPLFSSAITPWIIWAIHIVSALIVGIILPRTSTGRTFLTPKKAPSVSVTLERAIHVTANICGWVILFRIIIQFIKHWFMYLIPIQFQVGICGVLELANGCVMISSTEPEGLRFIFASCFLALGGFCVMMQTRSVTKDLGFGMYIQGKLLQLNIAFILSGVIQNLVFSNGSKAHITVHALILGSTTLVIGIFYIHRKKLVAFLYRLMYNRKKQTCT